MKIWRMEEDPLKPQLYPAHATSNHMQEALGVTILWAALRLASHKVALLPRSMSHCKKESFLLQQFNFNVNFFSKSWVLQEALPDFLYSTPLDKLNVLDLYRIREVICGGWQL